MLFHQIRFALRTLAAHSGGQDEGMGPAHQLPPGANLPDGSSGDPRRDLVQLIMQVVVSLAVLGLGGWLLTQGSETQQKAGSALIGVVTGYWLR